MIAWQLGRLVRELGKRPVVVVTDRYPPDTHGGAELSLQAAVSALPRKEELLVVTFTNRMRPHRYALDGVDVLGLPRPAKWPFHAHSPLLAVGAAWLRTGMPTRAVKVLERRMIASSGLPRDSLEDLVRTSKVRAPTGGFVTDFAEYSSGSMAVAALRTIVTHCECELVHADNYRSILAAVEATRGLNLRRVGVVRDNRFHCVRHDQSVAIRGVRCAHCDLACADEDASLETAPLQRALLERARAHRRSCLERLDRVIVTSRYLEGEIARVVPQSQIVRIPNARDELPEAEEARLSEAELPGTNLLVVGMLNENKGQLELVRQLQALVERIPDVRLHFAGRGARIERHLRRIAQESGCSERIVVHGYLGRLELYRLYRQCQIVVCPAVWPEPFGRVPLEAGLSRRPVVSFAVGGLRETIMHEQTGFLVEPADYGSLIAQLGALADDPVLRLRMGDNAYQHIVTHYDRRHLTRRLLRVWNQLRHVGQEGPEHDAT